MKTRTSLSPLLASFLISMLWVACYQSRPSIAPINPLFGKYISGFSSGMLSRTASLRIELSQGLNETDNSNTVNATTATISTSFISRIGKAPLPDSTLLDGIFSFEPAIRGKAVWISDKVIEFIPAEPLPANQFYEASFKLGKIKKVQRSLSNFPFQFSTYPQNLFIKFDGLRAYDNYNIEWQKLRGTVTTSDYEDTTLIKKTVQVSQNGKSLPVRWQINEFSNNEFRFSVDSIRRTETQGTVSVTWNGDVIKTIQNGKQEFTVAALGDFSVNSIKVIDGEDQYVELSFSDPISYNQNLKGIITLNGVNNLTYAVEANVVKVYLPNRLEGDKVISVTNGIKNFKGYKMNKPYSQSLFFEDAKPLVRIKGNGNILPNSSGLIFPFEAIGLKAVDVQITKIFGNNVFQFLQVNNLDGEDGLSRVGKIVIEKKIKLDYDKTKNLKQWNKHVLDLGKLINPDPGAIYRVSIKFRKAYALCGCEVTDEDKQEEANEKARQDENNENAWNGDDFENGYNHWYGYNENYSPCNREYYYGKAVSRNILASDIGLIYKLDDNKMSHAFVSNMITAKPMANVSIDYYDYTQQLIVTGTSDANGMLDIALKRKPFLMIACSGKQRGYLKLMDGLANSLSKFDVEGEVVQKGVKGFIYGERGVWRPGDSLYLNFIVEDKEKHLPPNFPVSFELHDPKGQIVYQTTKTKNLNGLYDFRTNTSTEAITGNYTAIAKLGNRTFSQTVKIETVKPNRLKIYMDFSPLRASNRSKDSLAKLNVKWLHGAIAKNLHAVVNVQVNQSETHFPKYADYEFDSPIRHFSSEPSAVFDGNLDAQGEAMINTHLHVGENAPGMLRATYFTKVFEDGGDFSVDRYSTSYSPFQTYVGLKCPDIKTQDNTFETGNTYTFDLATVNEKGLAVNASKLQVKIYKLEWRWWYEKNSEDLASYLSRTGTLILKDTLVKTQSGKGAFKFSVDYPEYGRYLITVTDQEGGHQTGKVIYIDWPYWKRGNRSDKENASMLNFSIDKEKYAPGEPIKLSFPSPAEGMALVSVENGTRVIQKFWIATKKGETKYEFPATKEMSPNAYLHVTLIQPHANTKNDLPIRMYGLLPVLVDDPATHLQPVIQMPEVIQPESYATVKVKEEKGRRMTYTLAMVDEGLLDLTRFKTPQPWNCFYAREALGVKTWDMYDAVIGAYAGKLDKLLSIGGDGDGSAGKSAKASRFKPMVCYSGPFELEAGGQRTHKIKIPNYVGSVRVMVVAENKGAYGSAEKTAAVRKPLMVLATLPRVLGPGESVYLPVDIFALEKQVKDVQVSVTVNGLVHLEGARQQSMHFSETGDEVINFKLNVGETIGIARVTITATSGKEKATQEIELDVRTPNPPVTDGTEKAIEPGKSWEPSYSLKGIGGTNKVTVEFSSIPPLSLEKRLEYLIQYPHGCIEQTTSSVFPQLFVGNLMDLKTEAKNKISENIKAGLRRLQLFQTSGGGFSYWPGESYESEWGTNYAGHFFIEAEKQGYNLPGNLKTRWVKYQQQQARNWNPQYNKNSYGYSNESNEVIQAYRLFVLALSNNAELASMNRLREEPGLSSIAKWRLAAAYKLVGQSEVATSLIAGISFSVKHYKELSYTYGSDLRDRAMILETLSLMDEKTKAAPLVLEVARSLDSEEWMSTQETAYSLLALCEYSGAKGAKSEMRFSCNLNSGTAVSQSTPKTLYQIKYTESELGSKGHVSIKNNGSATLFAKLLVEGIPLVGDQTASAKDLKITVKYKNLKGEEMKPDIIQQGTDFIAEVTLSNPGTKGFLKEMTLNQIFPSGWEIHNTRMDETAASSPARYQNVRDDRVYSYYELESNASKTFVIQLNATYLGRFYLPTVSSEAMYDHSIQARVPGRWVEVVREKSALSIK